MKRLLLFELLLAEIQFRWARRNLFLARLIEFGISIDLRFTLPYTTLFDLAAAILNKELDTCRNSLVSETDVGQYHNLQILAALPSISERYEEIPSSVHRTLSRSTFVLGAVSSGSSEGESSYFLGIKHFDMMTSWWEFISGSFNLHHIRVTVSHVEYQVIITIKSTFTNKMVICFVRDVNWDYFKDFHKCS